MFYSNILHFWISCFLFPLFFYSILLLKSSSSLSIRSVSTVSNLLINPQKKILISDILFNIFNISKIAHWYICIAQLSNKPFNNNHSYFEVPVWSLHLLVWFCLLLNLLRKMFVCVCVCLCLINFKNWISHFLCVRNQSK